MKKFVVIALVAAAAVAAPTAAFARTNFLFSLNLFDALPLFCPPTPAPVIVMPPPPPCCQQRTIVHEYHYGCGCQGPHYYREEMRAYPPHHPHYFYPPIP